MVKKLILLAVFVSGCAGSGDPNQSSIDESSGHLYSIKQASIDYSTYQPDGTDITSTYLDFFNSTDQSDLPQDLQFLKNYKVIFVEGILGNFWDFMGKLIFNRFHQMEVFVEDMNWLKRAGIETENLKIDTQASIIINKEKVAKAVKGSAKPVLFIAHSKGGIEVLAALLDHPEIRPNVAGVLFLQAPFMGTPIGDYISQVPLFDAITNSVFRLLGGNVQALHDLTSYERVPWMNQRGSSIDSVLSQVPMLSYSTWKDNILKVEDTIFEFTRDRMLVESKVANDGMVPWNSFILPHSRYVKFEGNDHGSTIMNMPHIQFDRVRFLKSMIRTLYSN